MNVHEERSGQGQFNIYHNCFALEPNKPNQLNKPNEPNKPGLQLL